jgi:hypothetical protein
VNNVDIEFLLRSLTRLRTISVRCCSTRRDNVVYDITPWILLVRNLQKICVIRSKRVLPSLRPLITMFMEITEVVLPVQTMGGDWDDRTFMNFQSMYSCTECVRDTHRPEHSYTSLCTRCVAALPPHLSNLRTFITYYGQ